MSAKLRLSMSSSRRVVAVMGWLVCLVVLVGVSVWLGVALRQRQAAMPGLSPNVPLAADKSYGVNADLTTLSPQALEATLTRMAGLGLSWVRQPFPWSEIEPGPGEWEWARWDRVVAAVRAHSLHLIALLDTTPAWARPPGSPPHTPPDELAGFGNFARALATRYAGQVSGYQIWDEPNLSAHWGNRFVDPAGYAQLLREAAVNLRAADAQAVILTAALAPTAEPGPLNLNEPDFLDRLYAAHAAEWFDGVAAEPYGFAAAPDQPTSRQRLNFGRAELLRSIMVARGDAQKPIWITAFGWSVLPSDGLGQPSPWPPVAVDRQGTYTSQAIAYARANWPWLGPMLLAGWDAAALPADDPRRGLAALSGDRLLPPGQALAAAAAGAALASAGSYPATHPSGQYVGDWRFSTAGAPSSWPGGSADVPRAAAARLTIHFEGTRLDLTVRRGLFHGFLFVTVDDQPANQLPEQSGRTFLGLYDPLEAVDTVTLARYLPDGRHTAMVEAEGGWYQWPILGWLVSREADVRSGQVGLWVAVCLAVVALGGSLYTARQLPLQDWTAGVYRAYLSLGTPRHLALLAAAGLAFYLAPGTLASLAALGALALVILLRPDLGLVMVAASIPFFLAPKALAGHTIALNEVGLLLVAMACVVWRALAARHSPPRRLDWLAWTLAALALACALLVLLPLPDLGGVTIDWAAFALVLLPPAGVLAALAQRPEPAGVPAANPCWLTRLNQSVILQLDVAVAGLVGLALAATLAAGNIGVAFQEFHVVVWDAAVFYAFIRLLRWLPPRSLAGEKQWDSGANTRRLVDAFWLGTTGMAAYAGYQFFFTNQSITAEGVHRALGLYGSPNNLALLLERAVPMLIAAVAFGWGDGPRPGWRVRYPMRRLLSGGALLLNLVVLGLTFSRGALWLGLPAALVFIGLLRGRRVLAAALASLAVAGSSLLPLLGTERLRSLFTTDAGTSFFRVRVWQSAWAMFMEHPWLGVGPDNFLYQYRTRYMLPDAWQEPDLSHAHNLLLDFVTRLGAGGLLILVWLQISFWRLALSVYRRLPEGQPRALILGLMASMVATLAHGLVDHAVFLVDLAYIFCLTLALVANAAV